MPKTDPPSPAVTAQARRAARARWGPRRVARLDQLDPALADVVRALLRYGEVRAEAQAGEGRNEAD